MSKRLDNTPDSIELTLIDFLASFISTNGVGVTKGYALAKRLFDLSVVSAQHGAALLNCKSEDDIFDALVSGSFPRGDYVARLVAGRISRSLEQVNSQGGCEFLNRLSASNFSQVSSLLLPLYGVGPKFVDTYCLLAGIEQS